MPMCSVCNSLFSSSSDILLPCCCNNVFCYICCQQAAIALGVEPDRTFFYFTNIVFIPVLNWIHSFVLNLIIASGCKFWVFDMCKLGYVRHEYTMFAGMLGIKQIICLY